MDCRPSSQTSNGPIRYEPDPGCGSREHRSAWAPSDPRGGTVPCVRDGCPEHADHLEQQLEQLPPDQATATLHLTDDVFLRSFNWARWQLGIPLPVEG